MAGDENGVRFLHRTKGNRGRFRVEKPNPVCLAAISSFSETCFPLESSVVPRTRSRLPILKTYKLAIGGKFPRGESGRVLAAHSQDGKTHLANYCAASRKDFRDAVVAARKAQPSWANATPYLRGQIIYRAAEMAELRRGELTGELTRAGARDAEREVDAAIDRLIHYAGWADKFAQVFGTVNPVATPHFNFTAPEPTGVVVALGPDLPSLLGIVSVVAPAVVGGNTVIALASERLPLVAVTLAEILATSDLPGGVFNLLTGSRHELAPHIATHLDVNAVVDAAGDAKIAGILRAGSASNLKRYVARSLNRSAWFSVAADSPYWILDTLELKTAWHPIGV